MQHKKYYFHSMKKYTALFVFILFFAAAKTQTEKPALPVPSQQQLQWHNMEFYLFVHFGPNTFTDLEWGKGTEAEDMFNPSALDCNQWCRIAKAAGAKGIIITAKHHDGFCLWPSAYSTHTVAESKWRNGKGDVLKELSDACKKYDLKMGIYLSPWDRNHPKYGTDDYNTVFINMMKEVVTKYGPFFEFWWDGANGEGPNGKKQIYDWHAFEQTMRSIAPNTVVFSDIGPDIRWVGNENGIAGITNWNMLDTAGFTRGLGAPSTDTLNTGNINGHNWIPAECDVSIRPGWFYHSNEDDKVKTPEQLFQLWLKSVGRGANLLLNVPPDRRGLINEHDSVALVGFKKLRDESFGKNLAKNAQAFIISHNGSLPPAPTLNDENPATDEIVSFHTYGMGLQFNTPELINCVVLKENILKGQYCKKFRLLLVSDKNEVLKQIDGTTIGRERIISFPSANVSTLTLIITERNGATSISEIETYLIDEKLIEQ